MVKGEGDQTLVTGLIDQETPYLNSDSVFGVRQAFVTACQPQNNAADMARLGLSQPELSGRFNVLLLATQA